VWCGLILSIRIHAEKESQPFLFPDWPVFGHQHRNPHNPLKTKQNLREIPAPAHTPMLLSSSNMEYSTDAPPLTTVQQCVVNALAAGSTITGAAEAHGVHRMTVYRGVKTRQEFSSALHRARAEFVLARRDDLALETLLAVLDNPRSSPAVLVRTSMFILQRPQLPKTGWSMPEPTPDPDGKKLIDSAVLEQDYDNLPGLYNIEEDDPAESPPQPEAPVESADSEPTPTTEPPVPNRDATECDEMLHDSANFDAPGPGPFATPRQTGLPSCPEPPAVREARRNYEQFLELIDTIKSVEEQDLPAGQNANETEEILV
jgi:hypothetical protein